MNNLDPVSSAIFEPYYEYHLQISIRNQITPLKFKIGRKIYIFFGLFITIHENDTNIAYIIKILMFGFTRITSNITSEIIVKSTKEYFIFILMEDFE